MRASLKPLGAVLLAAVIASACGGSHAPRARTTPRLGHRSLRVTVTAISKLPAPVADAAAAPLGQGRVVLLGGLDSSDNSTATITVLANGSSEAGGTLPIPQHDAQATQLGSSVYVFGGGQVSSYDHILSYEPGTSAVAQVGTLPSDASDVAVTSLGGSAYVVGGYDGTNALSTILGWRPGASPRIVAHLTEGLRYAALAPAGGRLIIAGGTTPSGVSDQILSFDPASGKVTRIGTLPTPLTHAGAAAVDGYVLVIGGRPQLNAQSSSILAVDPATGRVHQVGTLPQPLSDEAVAPLGARVLVAGGENATGVQSQVLELTASTTS